MSLGGLPLLFVLGLLLLAAVLWHTGKAWREESGLPAGDVIYTDAGAWERNEQVLHAPDLRLVGKPDYLVRQRGGMIVPVEVKSSDAPDAPWEGQVLQLAAYCYLVETTFGVRPSYGILQYKDRAFAIDYTDDLEQDLLDVLAEMRATMALPDVSPDHNDWRRCAGCGVRSACDRRLA
jgi:CRISPR-associated exonuclease Cas4